MLGGETVRPFSVLLVLAKYGLDMKRLYLEERERVQTQKRGQDQRLVYDYLLARYCNLDHKHKDKDKDMADLEESLFNRLLQVYFVATFVPSPAKQLVQLNLKGPVVDLIKERLRQLCMQVDTYTPENTLGRIKSLLDNVDYKSFGEVHAFFKENVERLNVLLQVWNKTVEITLILYL